MFYFDKHDDRVLFQDIRKLETTLCDGRHFEVNPDVQADFTNMPYPANSFRMVVFDPPHLLRSIENCKTCHIYNEPSPKNKATGYQMIKYGALGNADWKEVLRKGFAECFRVLMPGGFLIFKWNETDIKVSEILKLTSATGIKDWAIYHICFLLYSIFLYRHLLLFPELCPWLHTGFPRYLSLRYRKSEKE